jgi:pyruvate/2-oxoglutarate dehydrogenase complex dihydrolipoamide dehydrogenase (E3) component
LVVIGGGTAGLVSAVGGAGLGARVALIERARLGGDCLNVGCVPSKTLLRSARAIREIALASHFGVRAGAVAVDGAAVMARMREVRASLARNDSAQRLVSLGIDLYFGEARFTGARRVQVDGRELIFRRAVIATGGRPTVPPIPGLSETPYLTNETVFDLSTLPRRMLVLGAGAVGCEMAQAFALLGTEVTLTDVMSRPLSGEDPDASMIVERSLNRDGVRFVLNAALQRVSPRRSGLAIEWSRGSDQGTLEADALLVAAGRTPDIGALGLEEAGVRVHGGGIGVDSRLRTSNRRIYAAGDVAMPWKFTHAADASARLALRNALFFGRGQSTRLIVPWCTYTMPEVAHVGLSFEAASAEGARTITVPLADVDRAAIDGETEGYFRLHHDGRRVSGCTIVGPHAGDLITFVAEFMRAGHPVGSLANLIAPYPTYAEALRKVGDAYRRTLLTPGAKRLLGRYFALTRRWS